MQLLNGIATKIQGGDYVFVVESAGNTVSLSISVGGSASQQITDFSYTADANGVVTLPQGTLTAVIGASTALYLSGPR
jgi:hypothetical protein